MCIAWAVLAVSVVTFADDLKKIQPTGYVTDLAGVIKPQTKAQLEALSTELEQKTGAQLAIVTVKSLDGKTYKPTRTMRSNSLASGKRNRTTVCLLLVAPNDRKYWTEVGTALNR